MGTSPTALTLKYLRDRGAICDVSEHWNAFAHVRKDLFGFVDIVSLEPGRGIVGIQATERSHHSHRRRKILEKCAEQAKAWLVCNGCIEIWSWAKEKVKKGGKAEMWVPKVETITLEQFQ